MGGVITRLGQISDGGAAPIDQCPRRVGAVKIDLSHVPPRIKAKCRLYK
jgi:hypothetical protein